MRKTMGEVKSTLDLVMEKTKHLSLTKKEREAQQKAETGKRLKGLAQKFFDQAINIGTFEKELKNLETSENLKDRSLLVAEIVTQLDLGNDNTPLLVLLADVCGHSTERLESIFGEFNEKTASAKSERLQHATDELSERYSIAGSAVVPNLETDTAWSEASEKIKNTYREKLAQEISRILDT